MLKVWPSVGAWNIRARGFPMLYYSLTKTVNTHAITNVLVHAVVCVLLIQKHAALLLHETATSTCHSFQCQHVLIVTACSVLLSSL